jgi:undecaprenyl-diphosphatase
VPLLGLDMQIVEAVADLRSRPLTGVMELASAWWVKSVLLLALALAADLASRRRVPACFLSGALALAVEVPLSMALKGLFDRPRPAIGDPDFHAAIATPASAAMPSGHAFAAFAVATAIVLWHRRLGVPALAVAALVAASRVYLGVHFLSDVLVGAALGAAVGWLAVQIVRRAFPDAFVHAPCAMVRA